MSGSGLCPAEDALPSTLNDTVRPATPSLVLLQEVSSHGGMLQQTVRKPPGKDCLEVLSTRQYQLLDGTVTEAWTQQFVHPDDEAANLLTDQEDFRIVCAIQVYPVPEPQLIQTSTSITPPYYRQIEAQPCHRERRTWLIRSVWCAAGSCWILRTQRLKLTWWASFSLGLSKSSTTPFVLMKWRRLSLFR